MRWIQATLTFTANQYNAGRKDGHAGVWRVHHCSEVGNPLITRVDKDMMLDDFTRLGQPVLRMMVARPYQKGVIVKPILLALAFNEAARKDRASLNRILYQQPSETIYFGKAAQQHG